MKREPFDPLAPVKGEDLLEYEDFAAVLLNQPAQCWRNRRIVNFREAGRSEQAIRIWVAGFDWGLKQASFIEEAEALEREAQEITEAATSRGDGPPGDLAYARWLRPHHRRAQRFVAQVGIENTEQW